MSIFGNKDSMNCEILRLAIPNIVSNISIPLLSTVDTVLMGHLSATHLGAVGLGSMAFSFLYWNFGFLRMGTTGITAQAYGANDEDEVAYVIARSLVLGALVSVVLILAQLPLATIVSHLLSVRSSHEPLFWNYFSVRIWAAPATLMLFALLGWFFGLQNARIPLFVTLFSNVVNIALSYVLVRYYDLAEIGVAWGTVVAQYTGLLIASIIAYNIMKKRWNIDFKLQDMFAMTDLRRFLVINQDIFLRTIMLTMAFAFFYRESSVMGELVLATNIVLMQFVNWTSYGVDGFAYAAESITGKYYGSKNEEKLRAMVIRIFVWAIVLASFYALIYGIFRQELVALFTDDHQIRSYAVRYIGWIVIIPILAATSYVWDGVYVGLTASRAMRDTMFISLVTYIITYFLFQDSLGPHAIWLALSTFLLSRGVLQTYWVYRKDIVSVLP